MNQASLAPLDKASIPTAPVPAKTSKKVTLSHFFPFFKRKEFKILNKDSLALSDVGRVFSSVGVNNFLPLLPCTAKEAGQAMPMPDGRDVLLSDKYLKIPGTPFAGNGRSAAEAEEPA